MNLFYSNPLRQILLQCIKKRHSIFHNICSRNHACTFTLWFSFMVYISYIFGRTYIASPSSSWLDDFYDWLDYGTDSYGLTTPCCRVFRQNGTFCNSLVNGEHKHCLLDEHFYYVFVSFLHKSSLRKRNSFVQKELCLLLQEK